MRADIEHRCEYRRYEKGGTASQNNLNAINAFRSIYGLTPVTAAQLGHTYAFINVDMRLAKTIRLGGEH